MADRFQTVGEMADSLDEITILDWEPQKITRFTAKFVVGHFGDELIDFPINQMIGFLKACYIDRKIGSPDLAEQFADETLFDVAYLWHKQEKGIDISVY